MKPLEAVARVLREVGCFGEFDIQGSEKVARAALNAAAENVGPDAVVAAYVEYENNGATMHEAIKAALKKMAEG